MFQEVAFQDIIDLLNIAILLFRLSLYIVHSLCICAAAVLNFSPSRKSFSANWQKSSEPLYAEGFAKKIMTTSADASLGEPTGIKKPAGLSHAFSWQH